MVWQRKRKMTAVVRSWLGKDGMTFNRIDKLHCIYCIMFLISLSIKLL